jgi:hypothetical protein
MKKALMILIAIGAIGWFAGSAKIAEAGGCYRPHHGGHGGHYGYYQPYHRQAYRYQRYNYYRPYAPQYYHHHHHGGVYFSGPRVSFGFGY